VAGKIRRIAVLGVTSLGTWAVVPTTPPPGDTASTPTVQVVPADTHAAAPAVKPDES
jgi:hypothetical protein